MGVTYQVQFVVPACDRTTNTNQCGRWLRKQPARQPCLLCFAAGGMQRHPTAAHKQRRFSPASCPAPAAAWRAGDRRWRPPQRARLLQPGEPPAAGGAPLRRTGGRLWTHRRCAVWPSWGCCLLVLRTADAAHPLRHSYSRRTSVCPHPRRVQLLLGERRWRPHVCAVVWLSRWESHKKGACSFEAQPTAASHAACIFLVLLSRHRRRSLPPHSCVRAGLGQRPAGRPGGSRGRSGIDGAARCYGVAAGRPAL